MKIHIIGTAISKTGELWDKSLRDLLEEVVVEAVKDAKLKKNKIEAVFVANMAAGSFNDQRHLNAMVSEMLDGFPPAVRVEGACASGSLAMLMAENALLAGQYKTVLVVGAEKMLDVSTNEATKILATAADSKEEYGSIFPGLYAMLAQQHMAKYGTTRDQLSSVAVKNHRHALDNPHAQFRRELTIEAVNKSQLVADPLRIFDCSPISDGAAAVVLTTKKSKNKPVILGFGQGQDSLSLAKRNSLVGLEVTKKAAKLAYKMAKLKPKDIQIAEVHDCFTIAEILAIEDLGFFAKSKGGQATLDGKTTHGGKILINASGGLKASGHPIGATGIKQIAFLAKEIERGNFNVGLAHNVGGSGATAVVHILSGKEMK